MIKIIPTVNPEQGFMKFHVWIVIKKYVGETSHSFYKPIYKHPRDLKRAKINNGLVKHNLKLIKTLMSKILNC